MKRLKRIIANYRKLKALLGITTIDKHGNVVFTKSLITTEELRYWYPKENLK